MRIVCPFCDAAYDVPESVLTTRTMLRCARCGSDFRPPEAPGPAAPAPVPEETANHPAPEPDPPAEPPPAPMAPEPAVMPAAAAMAGVLPQPAARAEPRRDQILAAWAFSLLVIAAALWLGIAHRRSVMQAWPPSIRLYAIFGAHPP